MVRRPSPSLAERVAWLFAVVVEDVVDPATGNLGHREFSSAAVARSLTAALGRELHGCTEVVEQLRRGIRAAIPEMAVFAAFFGVPLSYLADDDPELIEAVDNDLLTGALEDCDLKGYRVCRSSLVGRGLHRRRARLLEFARGPEAMIANPHSAATSACDDGSAGDAAGDGAATEGEKVGPDRLMTSSELAELCEELVWQLDMRPPLDPHEMCRRLAKTRGRKITVVAGDLGGEVSMGHLKAGRHSDRIGHDQNAPKPLAAHVIFHEVIHIVRRHLDGPGEFTCGTNFGAVPEDVSLYADWAEWEAEAGATYLSEMSRRRYRPRMLSRNARPADRALAATFGLIATDRHQ